MAATVATIHLVSSDLSHQETILQIVDALDHLEKITEQVFSRIQSKIDENAQKLASLDKRVDVADQKVKKLSEMKTKATCIYSSSKYPDENELNDYQTTFANMKVPFKVQDEVKIQDLVKTLDVKEIKDKKRYFHLPMKKKPTVKQILDDTPDLRTPTKDSKSALSYLVFNTAENVFSKANKNDLMNTINQKSKSKKDTSDEPDGDFTENSLGEAPTFASGDGLMDQGLLFAPALGDLPDLDLPDILDLPNLPTDLSYMTDLGPGIAPSIQSFPDLTDEDLIIPDEAAEAILAAPPPPPPPEFIPAPPPSSVIFQDTPTNLTEIPKAPPPPPISFQPSLEIPEEIEASPEGNFIHKTLTALIFSIVLMALFLIDYSWKVTRHI